MSRWLAVRVIALALMLNGAAGVLGSLVAWRASQALLDDLRAAGTLVPTEQARLVTGVRDVATMIGDAADATGGFSASLEQAHAAVADSSQSADELRVIFEQLSLVSRLELLELRPLSGLTDPFAASAQSFGRLSTSLGSAAGSLEENRRDTSRVATDLHLARAHIDELATTIDGLQSQTLLNRGVAEAELGRGVLVGLLLLQALLSGLTGLALWLLAGQRPVGPARPIDDASA